MRGARNIAAVGLIVVCLLHAVAFAADRTATSADLEKLHDQVRALDKDLSVLKETSASKLDAQDKRLSDIALATAQHGNHLEAISNQTSLVGNYIAWTSAVITLLVFVAGFITYVSAKNRAEKEARDTAEQWFKQRAAVLTQEIEDLRLKASSASTAIAEYQEGVASKAKATEQAMEEAARSIIDSATHSVDGTSDVASDPDAVALIRKASDALKEKPESSFTANDHYARGLDFFAASNYQSALSAFDNALKLLATDVSAQRTAIFLFNKGVTLGKLSRSEEAIAVYDEIDRRYGKDESPGVRERVARALFNKGCRLGVLNRSEEAIAVFDEIDRRYGKDESPGVREQVAISLNSSAFDRIMMAKADWTDETRRRTLISLATGALERALTRCAEEERPMVLGNLGYSQFLSGQQQAARAPTLECLKMGGQKQLNAQRADARQHRVEPEDSNYELLLDEFWRSLLPPDEGPARRTVS